LTSELPDIETYRRLGRALSALRRKAGLTQVQLGERIGVRGEFVSTVERANRGLRWHKLVAWLDACDATLAELGALLDADGR
jgi:transcriptional regulator with XRE-family HTH domain